MTAELRVIAVAIALALAGVAQAAERSQDEADKRALPCHIVPASGLALKTGQHSAAADLAELPRPAKGESYRDPDYGVCVVRVTDHEHEPPTGFARNYYSRFQPFNADESLLLVFARNGEWHLYDAATFRHVKTLSLGGGSVEPQWHPRDPHKLYVLPDKGGMQIDLVDIRDGKRTTVVDFTELEGIAGHRGARSLKDVWPEAARVWTRWEGSPSMDARYWAFLVETKDGDPLGMITLDLEERVILGTYDTQEIGRPDHISMSPLGNFAVASWTEKAARCPLFRKRGSFDRPCGVMAFTRDFREAVGLAAKSPHSDLAVDADGREVIVVSNYDSGNVEMIELATGKVTPLWRIYIDGASTAMHISGKAWRRPGWVLISTYWMNDPKEARPWYRDKLMAVELREDPRIINIASIASHVRSYFSEPHATVNRDFTRIVFNANWLTGRDDDVDVYMALLPPSALRDDTYSADLLRR